MEKKTAIVTGAGQGIGKAIAIRLLAEDIRVIIADQDKEAGDSTLEELKGHGEVRFIQTDISKETEVTSLISAVTETYTGIDYLVNNAGITEFIPLDQISLADWNRLIGINLTGAFLCAKEAAPFLKKSKGAIVNIASTRGLMSEPDNEAYSASKGGLIALTHALANSLGPDVRVNCVSPGWIEVSELKKPSKRKSPSLSEADHKQHPAGRVGKAEDVAEMVYFLLSDKASFITGQNFVIDGGMIKKMIYVE